MNVLAFDIGASSGRGIAGLFDGSRLALKEIYRFDNGTVEKNGHLHWDVDRLHAELRYGLHKAASSHTIASIGIDTWGVDGAFLDENNLLLGLPYGYRDFTEESMREYIGVMGAKELYAVTGIQFLPFNTLFQLYHHIRCGNPVMCNARKFMFMPDYLRYLFTGETHTEYTIASTSQLLDARTRDWSSAVLEAYNIPPHLLEDIIKPGTICGTVRETGIPAVAVAGHDTASAVLAVPAGDTGTWAWLSSGTWSIMGIENPEPIIKPEGLKYNFSNEGGINGTIRYLKNIMGLWIVQECRRLWAAEGSDYSYVELDTLAQQVSKPVAGIPVNDNRFLAPEDMREEICAVCRESGQPEPGTPGAFMKCILASLANEYARTLQYLEELTGNTFSVLHIVGGGCQNHLLNQMTADACGIPVLAGPVEATAIGNILMQLIAHREVNDIKEARQLVQQSFSITRYAPGSNKIN
jgi:rhamnulokinase